MRYASQTDRKTGAYMNEERVKKMLELLAAQEGVSTAEYKQEMQRAIATAMEDPKNQNHPFYKPYIERQTQPDVETFLAYFMKRIMDSY